MFERYTEKARRVIFFARYEASQFGSPYIETEHMLLGILREDKALTKRFLRSRFSVASIRGQIERATGIRERLSTSVDLPLSDECKRILAYAAEEAEKLEHKHIGTEHLTLGMLREENCFAAKLLNERGVQIASLREELGKAATEAQSATAAASAPAGLFRDLTQAAAEGSLEPIVGRDAELAAIIEVLCSSRKNPVLVGPKGAGKTTIVYGLAQRIADGTVPPRLARKRLIEVDPLLLAGWTSDKRRFEEFTKSLCAIATPDQTILFIDCFQKPSEARTRAGVPDFTAFLKWLLSQLGLQYIAVADEQEFGEAVRTNSSLKIFREIHVRPLDENESLMVLRTRKVALEEFHSVTYSEGALEAAVRSAAAQPSRGSLLQTALDLLDAAGALHALRSDVPQEIAEAEKKIVLITEQVEQAILNHEFEKARFYSGEERKERDNLRALKAGSPEVAEITANDIGSIVSRWSAYPYTP